ncbi:MAG: ABC transporter substrate-binding protein [Janthinobacterium lividum]
MGAAPLAAQAQAQAQATTPISIGLLLPKQGVLGEVGEDSARGAMLALDDVHGKALNRPVKLVWLDDPNPQAAQENFSKLLDNEHVAAVVGGSGSASALAEAALATRRKTPLMIVTGGATELTGKNCSRYTFRTFSPIQVESRALSKPLLAQGKKWYFLIPDYATGYDTYKYMKAELVKAGGQDLGMDKVPLSATDFGSFILKIRQAKPDVVAVGLVGDGYVSFLKQWQQYGMAGKIPVGDPSITDSMFWALEPNALTGTYVKLWDYKDPANPPAEQKFTADYRAKYGIPPSSVVWSGWMSMHAVLAAIEAGKSTDSASIVHQLETLQWHDRKVTSYYRPWDHQFIHPIAIAVAHAPKADKWDVMSVSQSIPDDNSQVDAIFGTRAEVGCQMGDL